MIRVIIKKKCNLYIGVNITGHAGMADIGEDIVCAAVSVLGTTLLNYLLADYPDLKFHYSEGKDAQIFTDVKDISGDDYVQNGFKYFDIGMRSLVESYGEYINLSYQEV